ncbi:MAG TPA: flagellar hook-basal body protein [Melioribacteraceae bacterium]|nr:flagellar hook-basal body protein [Melioribacteraceae bacterium]
MIKGLYNSGISMHTRMKNMEIISNNLANLNTTGFKREVPFSEYLSREDGVQVKVVTDFSNGSLIETGNPFDLSITGKGFFTVQGNNGIELTKNGRFSLSEDGFLIDERGARVLSSNGAINVFDSIIDKNKPITITKDGLIKQGDIIIDRLSISTVENPDALVRTEGQNFKYPNDEYIPANEYDFEILQGYLEESNSNPIIELENMIRISKDFEASQKAVNAIDTILGQAKEIGRV